MPLFNKCCCCCDLSVGGMVLGWVTMVFRVIILISLIYTLANIHAGAEQLDEMNKELHSKGEHSYSEMKDFGALIDTVKAASSAILGLVILIVAFAVLASILLIVGSMKKRRMMLIPYLILDTLVVILFTIGFIFSLAGIGNNFSGVVVSALFAGLNWYWYLSVIALFQEIKENESLPNQSFLMRQNPHNPNVYQPTVGYAK